MFPYADDAGNFTRDVEHNMFGDEQNGVNFLNCRKEVLAAGVRHEANYFFRTGGEFMALGFSADGGADGLFEILQASAGAQQGTQLGLVLLTETGIERPVHGQAHPIAGFAEMLRDGRDKADLKVGAGDLDIARRAAAVHDCRD